MKKLALGLAFSALAVTGATAADVPLNNAAIANLMLGKQVFLGGGVATFGKNGAYNFAGLFNGKWRATKRSVCVSFDSPEQVCSRVVRNGKNYFLVDAQGQRTLIK